jgi:tetratricopeptide (TPR) repeat protein
MTHEYPPPASANEANPASEANSRNGVGSSNELSGTVVGPSVQAGAIHGDLHFHSVPAASMPVPRQLPAPPLHFTGRAEELSRLDELLKRRLSRIVILTGTGGVGKTALSVVWAHRVRDRFPDGQLYADLGAFNDDEPADPGEVLGMFLRALGVAPQAVPATLAEQAAMYRSLTDGRAMLVALDNAFSAAQVRVLLPASESSTVVVTTRGWLAGLLSEGAELVEVRPLAAAEAVALLTRTVGSTRVAQERRSAEALAEICGGLPIALCVTAARLVTRPRLSLERMAAELSDEDSRLRGLSIVDGASVPAAFDVSYRSLDPTAAMLYRRLALHPGPSFGLGLVAVVLAHVHEATAGGEVTAGGEPDRTPEAAVATLVAASLLQEVDEDRFRFHDLLRLHAKLKLEEDEPKHDRDAVLRRLLEWYWAGAARADAVVTPYRRRLPYPPATSPDHLPLFTDRETALGWLDRERVNLMAAGRAAMEHGHHELAWHLSDVLWPLFLVRKHYRDRMEADRRGVAAAQAWGGAWPHADMRKRLGRSCTTAGDFAEAELHLRAAVELYREADDARGSLDAREALAALYRDSGRAEPAVAMFREVLTANRGLGDDRCTGLTLINLGTLLSTLGQPAEALRLLLEAKGLLAKRDPYNEVRATIGLAGAYSRTGDLSHAEAAATEAARRMRDLGSDFERAEALHLLGEIAQRRGDTSGAGRRYRAALDIYTALGSARAGRVRSRLAELPDGTSGGDGPTR